MGAYRDRKPEPLTRCYAELGELLAKGAISPLLDSVVGFEELPDAFRRLNDRGTVGRVIFVPSSGDQSARTPAE